MVPLEKESKEPKNNKSTTKNEPWFSGSLVPSKTHIGESGHNGGSESKGHTNIVTNLEETKQFLRISGFEIWSNGTVKCKSCNGKMDIPSAVNHTCTKRTKKEGVKS